MTVREQIALASALYEAGLVPVPLRPTGAKRPAVRWAGLKVNRPARSEVLGWFGAGERGFAVLGGSVSAGLEALDFDNHGSTGSEFEQWLRAIPRPLRSRLVVIQTPNAGWRVPWYFPDDTDWDGRVLARRDRDSVSVEHHRARLLNWPGGSPLCHPTGRPYVWAHGSWESIPTLTAGERELAVRAAEAQSVWTKPPADPKPQTRPRPSPAGRPGVRADWWASDDFDRRAVWDDVLTPHGWEWWAGDNWSRPGRSACASATVNYAGSDLLYVFSESTPFEPRKGYQKWAAFAVLNHTDASGRTDFSGAVKDLARQGYGRANSLGDMEQRVSAFYSSL